MAIIINNPSTPQVIDDGADAGMAMIVTLVVILVLAFIFFAYGLPALRVNQTAPAQQTTQQDQGSINANVTGGVTNSSY
jgi:hypothetical protein